MSGDLVEAVGSVPVAGTAATPGEMADLATMRVTLGLSLRITAALHDALLVPHESGVCSALACRA